MAIITSIICDRCGYVEQDPPNTMRLIIHPSENIAQVTPEKLDLCCNCEKGFLNWYRGGREPKR